MALRFMTAGESHGPFLVVIIDGVPAGLTVTQAAISRDLERRQSGYGRGGRMKIEHDQAKIVSGVRLGSTIGSPVSILIENRDFENWRELMSPEPVGSEEHDIETKPRPGHGDLAGMLKYSTRDARDVLERASARETAARTAAGAVARLLIGELGITVVSRVVQIGPVRATGVAPGGLGVFEGVDEDPVRSVDSDASGKMTREIEKAAAGGDSLGGVFEVVAFGVMPGLGSMAQYDRRLDGRISGAVASIPGIKGVEIGDGFAIAGVHGSGAHDEIMTDNESGVARRTNHAGGLEAGMTNGEPLVVRAVMKPIPSLGRPLSTIDTETMEKQGAFKERADICAVPAASVVGEAMVCLVLAEAVCEKFGGDSIPEMKRNLEGYLERISGFYRRSR